MLHDAYPDGRHPSQDDRKPRAKFVDPSGVASFDALDIGFFSKTPPMRTHRVRCYHSRVCQRAFRICHQIEFI